jgi:hypothetical protein
MVLVFAHHYDEEAKWLALSLQVQGMPLKLLVAEALGIDYDISLTIKEGKAGISILFKDDTGEVGGNAVSLVINRLNYINPIVWANAAEKEKQYATNEINAFFAALLRAFNCRVLNPVEHGSLFTDNKTGFDIVRLLKQQQVDVAISALEEDEQNFAKLQLLADNCLRVLCWEEEVFFPVHQPDAAFSEMILSSLSGKKISHPMELFFTHQPDGYSLTYISKSPALSLYGQPLLQSILRYTYKPEPCY